MASGDSLLFAGPLGSQQYRNTNAYHGYRGERPTLEFIDNLDRDAMWHGVMPGNYSGNGLTVNLFWVASATTGDVRWQVQVERLLAGTDDVDTNSSGIFTSIEASPAGIPGVVVKTTIVLVDNDSIASGDLFKLEINRDANSALDTMSGNAQLLAVELIET